MAPEQIASYLARVRVTDDPKALAMLRAELDARYRGDKDARWLTQLATVKRVRLLHSG